MLVMNVLTTMSQRHGLRLWIVIVVSFVALLSAVAHARNRRFDPAIWRATSAPNPARLEMVDDLLESRQLIGVRQSQVDDLLGKPEINRSSSTEYVYYLGPERGFISIDDEWLVVKIANGHAVSAVVRPD